MYIPTNNFWMLKLSYETWYVYHGTWAHLNRVIYKSLPSVIPASQPHMESRWLVLLWAFWFFKDFLQSLISKCATFVKVVSIYRILIKKLDGCTKSVCSFLFDSNDWYIIAVGHVKFCMEMDHKCYVLHDNEHCANKGHLFRTLIRVSV
jgi:hypothetical protein